MPKPLFQLRFLAAAGLSVGLALGAAPARSAGPDPAQAAVEAAARSWLQAMLRAQGRASPRIDLAVVAPARQPPACATPEAEVVDGSRPDRLRVALRCAGSGQPPAAYVVRVALMAPVVVVQEQVPAGRALEAGALGVAEHDLALFPDALADPDLAAGRSTRRSLRRGQVLQERFLYAEDGVRRGQGVRIVAGRPGFEVSIAGTALQDGAPSAMVTVRNRSTGRIVNARVVGNGVVQLVAGD